MQIFTWQAKVGIQNLLCDKWIDINAVVIESKDGTISYGMSQGFPIPNKYIDDIREKELGKVMDRIFDGNNLGKGKGGIGILTHEEMTRVDLTRNAFIMALTTFINGEVWK